MAVQEEVVSTPSLCAFEDTLMDYPGIFSLRIDADEYHDTTYGAFAAVFKDYKNAVSIFYNANSFADKRQAVERCQKAGIDIQSHAYFHYTYRDYASNHYNTLKAKAFFKEKMAAFRKVI